jgi:hypothetical protein
VIAGHGFLHRMQHGIDRLVDQSAVALAHDHDRSQRDLSRFDPFNLKNDWRL